MDKYSGEPLFPDGIYTIKVTAYDFRGHQTTAFDTVEVKNEPLPPKKLNIITTTGGSTDPAPGEYFYAQDTKVVLDAVPGENAIFDKWTGNVPPGHEKDNPRGSWDHKGLAEGGP